MIKVRPRSLRARRPLASTAHSAARPQNIPNKLKDYEVMAFIEEVRTPLSLSIRPARPSTDASSLTRRSSAARSTSSICAPITRTCVGLCLSLGSSRSSLEDLAYDCWHAHRTATSAVRRSRPSLLSSFRTVTDQPRPPLRALADGFCNFTSTAALLAFAKARLGTRWNLCASDKLCVLSYANIQVRPRPRSLSLSLPAS